MILKPGGGFINTRISSPDKDWVSNDKEYTFGPFGDQGFEWSVAKHPGGNAEVWVSGPFGQSFHVEDIPTIPISPTSRHPDKVDLMIEWKEHKLRVRFNMIAVAALEVTPA
jgi:hypothetical protein